MSRFVQQDRAKGKHSTCWDDQAGPELVGVAGVSSLSGVIPTLVVFKGGQAVEGAVGALSMQELKRLLEPHLAAA